MGKINLDINGGNGPYNIIVREISELSGNRYIGPNPTTTLNNLDINYIKDGIPHLYSVSVSNGVCSQDTETFEHTCECEVTPSFVASQDCSNPQDPKITVTASSGGTGLIRIRIYNSSNVVVHDITSTDGTQLFSVNNNSSYRINVSLAGAGLENCKANDQIINISCTVTCSLNVTISNPMC